MVRRSLARRRPADPQIATCASQPVTLARSGAAATGDLPRSRRRWRGRSSASRRIRWSRSRSDRCTRRTPRRVPWSRPALGGRGISRSGARRSGPTGWSRGSPRIARPWPSIPRSPKRTCASDTCCCSPARPTTRTPRSRASAETGDRRWRYLAEMLRADAADARGDRAAARSATGRARGVARRAVAGAGPEPPRGFRTRTGRRRRGRLSTLAPRAGGRAEDPWWAYGFGQAWRIDAGLATLRRLVVR